jgi:hypothetical protein
MNALLSYQALRELMESLLSPNLLPSCGLTQDIICQLKLSWPKKAVGGK